MMAISLTPRRFVKAQRKQVMSHGSAYDA